MNHLNQMNHIKNEKPFTARLYRRRLARNVVRGVIHEIRSPVTGVLSKILVKDGGSVEAGTELGMISQF
jgi:hypothetical protein